MTAFAPAGGWVVGDAAREDTFAFFATTHEQLQGANPVLIASTLEGRRRATAALVERADHIPTETVIALIQAAANCPGTPRMIEAGRREDWALDPARIDCPIRFVWGTADKLLPWPGAARRYQRDFPHADWVVLEDVGHCPQLERPLETAELILA